MGSLPVVLRLPRSAMEYALLITYINYGKKITFIVGHYKMKKADQEPGQNGLFSCFKYRHAIPFMSPLPKYHSYTN